MLFTLPLGLIFLWEHFSHCSHCRTENSKGQCLPWSVSIDTSGRKGIILIWGRKRNQLTSKGKENKKNKGKPQEWDGMKHCHPIPTQGLTARIWLTPGLKRANEEQWRNKDSSIIGINLILAVKGWRQALLIGPVVSIILIVPFTEPAVCFRGQVMELEGWVQSLSIIVIVSRFVNERQSSR